MKWIISIIIIIFLSGCSEGEEAIQEADKIVKDYSKGLVEAPKKTKILTEIAVIRKSLEIYKIENGKYPESLSELQIKIKEVDEYQYDSESGKVKSKNYPNLWIATETPRYGRFLPTGQAGNTELDFTEKYKIYKIRGCPKIVWYFTQI